MESIPWSRKVIGDTRIFSILALVAGSLTLLICWCTWMGYRKQEKELDHPRWWWDFHGYIRKVNNEALAEALETIRRNESAAEEKKKENDEESDSALESSKDSSDEEVDDKKVVMLTGDDMKDHNYTIENSVVYITSRPASPLHSPLRLSSKTPSLSYQPPTELEHAQNTGINDMLMYKLRK